MNAGNNNDNNSSSSSSSNSNSNSNSSNNNNNTSSSCSSSINKKKQKCLERLGVLIPCPHATTGTNRKTPLWLTKGYREITPIMENQMEKYIENEPETRGI